MDPLHDPRCLATTEALFLDGANGVCGVPRHGAGELPPLASVLVFALVLVAALALHRRRALASHARLVLAVVLVLAVPGLWAIVAERADRPLGVSSTAFEVVRAHDEVHAFATAHGGARLRTETEISIVPVARLALTGVAGDGTAPIDLFDDTLEDGCVELSGTLTCGTAPGVFREESEAPP